MPDSAGRPVGIDLSSHNHPTNLALDGKAVKAAGVEFAIIKFTEYTGNPATNYVNPWGQIDYADLKFAGVAIAGYLYLHPDQDPAAAAEYYLANSPPGVRGVFVDLEVVVAGGNVDALRGCAERLQADEKVVGLYTDRSMYAWLGPSVAGLVHWLGAPTVPQPVDLTSAYELAGYSVDCWQPGQGSVPGIVGLVDINRWMVPATFETVFGPAPTPPVVTPDPQEEPDMPADLTDAAIEAVATRVLQKMNEAMAPGNPDGELYDRTTQAATKAVRETILPAFLAPQAAPTPAPAANPADRPADPPSAPQAAGQ